MKSSFRNLFLMLIVCSCLNANAQEQMGRRTPEQRAQMQLGWMQKNLFTTDEQNKKAYDILFRYAKRADDLRNSPGGGNGEKRQEMEGINAGRDAELKTVLSADQYQKYQAHVAEMKDKMRQRGGGMQN